MSDRLDVGCGPRKRDGFDGMDVHAYPGVDIVHDLDAPGTWPIPDDRYGYIQAIHVVEHIRDLRKFFAELHRVARPGALIRLETPHYSSSNSWADPTHIHHLSVSFCAPFLEGYLGPQFPLFRLESERITFGGLLHTWPARLYCRVFGYGSYERHFAWMVPASGVIVELRVRKPERT